MRKKIAPKLNIVGAILSNMKELIEHYIKENEYLNLWYESNEFINVPQLDSIMNDACCINTFQLMFRKILIKKKLPTFSFGIGLGVSEDLIVKAGKKGTGINDLIWIGDAVIDASNLSGMANRKDFSAIVMDSCFYENIKDLDASNEHKYKDFISSKYSYELGKTVYHTNLIEVEFNNWIEEKV